MSLTTYGCIQIVFLLMYLTVLIKCDDCMKIYEPKLSRTCCKIPYTDEVAKNCSHNLMIPSPHEPKHMNETRKSKLSMHMCIAECEFKQKAYLKGSTDIDFVAVNADLTHRYPQESEYVKALIGGLHKCLEFARKKTKDMHWLESSESCSFFPGILIACAYQQVIMNCPHNKWEQSKQCEELKTFLQKCDSLKNV